MRFYRITLILFIILIVGFIAYNSTRTATQSADISQGVTDVVVGIVRPDYSEKEESEQETIVDDLHVIVRNLAHSIEYAALAFFLALLLFTCKFNYGRYALAMIITLLFCFVFATTDEILQLAVDGRGAEISDVAMDVLGASIAILCAALVDKIGVMIFSKYKKLKQV